MESGDTLFYVLDKHKAGSSAWPVYPSCDQIVELGGEPPGK